MKITLAQKNFSTNDIELNVNKIIDAAHEAKGSSLVIFPEFAVCGMNPYGHLSDDGFVGKCEKALDRIAVECVRVAVLLGCPVRNTSGKGKPFYNAAVYLFQGQRKIFKKKQLGLSDKRELEYFEPSDENEVLQVGCHKFAVTIGSDMYNIGDDELLIQNRVDDLMPLAPDVIVNIASEVFDYQNIRNRISGLRQNVLKTERPLVFVNNVGRNEDKIYDGHSMIFGYEGYVVASNPFLQEKVNDVDLVCLISMKQTDIQDVPSKEELENLADKL